MTKPPAGKGHQNFSSAEAKRAASRVGSDQPAGTWFKRMFDPVFIALMAVSCVTAAWGIVRAAADGPGEQPLTMSLYFFGAALPTAWSVLRGMWHPDPEINPIMSALLRTVVAPFVSIWPAIITAGITVSLPSTQALIDQSSRPNGWHYTFSPDDGTPLGIAMGLGGLMCLIAAMLVGLALAIVVVLPGMAFFKPKVAIEGNMLDTSDETLQTNTIAMRFMAILLVLVFAIPTLIVFGEDEAQGTSVLEAFQNSTKFLSDPSYFKGDLAWTIGILLIPIGVLALIMVKVKQKPDHATRAEYGVSALGDVQKGDEALAQKRREEKARKELDS